MAYPIPVTFPLINPNEREAVLTGVFIHEGQQVTAGTPLATVESTKSSIEIVSEASGFAIGLTKKVGEAVLTGEVLCYLAESPDAVPPEQQPSASSVLRAHTVATDGLRISNPALELAKQAGLNLDTLPRDRFLTERDIRALLPRYTPHTPTVVVEPNSLLLYGGGGHGKTLIELIRAQSRFQVAGIIDDGMSVGERVLDIEVIGHSGILDTVRSMGITMAVNGVGGIGNLNSRLRVFELLTNAGYSIPTVLHPRAFIEPSATITEGAQVFALSYIGSSCRIGFGCIINTGAILSHDCVVGDCTNISPGAILAGSVRVEENVLVGMGATINLNVQVGAGVRIGNGATIKGNVPAGTVVKAGSIWPV